MPIDVYVGLPGHGKSTLANIHARETLLRFKQKARVWRTEERGVAANFEIHHPEIGYIPDFAGVKEMRNTTYFMDEAARWFSKRNWSETKEEDLYAFRQSRKDGNNLVLIAHGANDIESKIFENLATHVWEVRRLLGPDPDGDPTPLERMLGWWALAVRYRANEYMTPSRRSMGKPRLFNILDYHGQFDSFVIIGNRHGEGGRSGESFAAVEERNPANDAPAWSKERYLRGVSDLAPGINGVSRFQADLDDDLERMFIKRQSGPVLDTFDWSLSSLGAAPPQISMPPQIVVEKAAESLAQGKEPVIYEPNRPAPDAGDLPVVFRLGGRGRS